MNPKNHLRPFLLGLATATLITAGGTGGVAAEPAATAAATAAPTAEASAAQRLTVPLSDPSRPATIKVSLVNGGISVEAYGGKDVVIEAVPRHDDERDDDDDDKEPAKSTAGMHRIPNTSLGLTAEEESNEVRIGADSVFHAVDLRIQVPASAVLHLGCVNDGDIKVKGVTGEMELSNTNGSITVEGAGSAVVAHTVNGEIKVDLRRFDAGKSMAFSTLNGDVDVTFPAALKANVRMRSDNGEIYTDFDVALSGKPGKVEEERAKGHYRLTMEREMSGTINGGGPDILFKTFNGDIYIRKAKS